MLPLKMSSVHVFVVVLVLTSVIGIAAKRFRSFSDFIDDSLYDESSQELNLKKGEVWVVLVAGSNGWYNYRHQSDVCHAYQVLRKHRIPEENIITMMYDDIADNTHNPYPGKIFNVPNGRDVYAGVKIDYSGSHVTPENFLAVLSGNKLAVKGGNGKVVKSTSDDRIFVYFTDHGGIGLVSFPDSILTAKDLNDELKNMHAKRKFEKLVFYMEACESGSMFSEILPSNIDVYAVTAANDHESSWGCFCHNKMELPCLADCFSISWLLDTEKENLYKETLARQFSIIKNLTDKSHVMHYGDMAITHDHVADFMSGSLLLIEAKIRESVAWPSRDVYLRMLEKQLHEAERESDRQILRHKITKLKMIKMMINHKIVCVCEIKLMKRKYLETFLISLVQAIVPHNPQYHFVKHIPFKIISLNCFDQVVKAFHQSCFHFGHLSTKT
ncbi:unnamed protein product, partial [Thelazia callipaeda]|uniref:legumain n=1 Tax=Thelazia callipaeda TaxID=103827 RepID=A0A0N5CRM1_THECL